MSTFKKMLDTVRVTEFERAISQPAGGVEVFAGGDVEYDRAGEPVLVRTWDEHGRKTETWRQDYIAK